MIEKIIRIIKKPTFWILTISLFTGWAVGRFVTPTWSVEKITLDVHKNHEGHLYYVFKGNHEIITKLTDYSKASLSEKNIAILNQKKEKPLVKEEYVFNEETINGKKKIVYYKLKLQKHYSFWSLLPALIAIVMAWLTKEPMTSLFAGIVAGAFMLGMYDIIDEVLLSTMMTKDAAGILLLYLILLGALMGIWSRTGGASAFAEFMTKKFVKGPRSAKLVAWFLGLIFFQGGTVSTVLVGTTVKPITDKEKISHEELSYIVDSTASPIASILAFNAWPGYVQAFIFVSGVGFLATETDRIAFFFKSIPLSFYSIFAVLGTFLLAIDKAPFLGKKMREAIKRSRSTEELNHPLATPLSAKELEKTDIPAGYQKSALEFILPLLILISIAVVTFIVGGSPKVRWAFGAAVLFASLHALFKGMSIQDLISGISTGLKGVVTGSMILILAITIGFISKSTGGGLYLVDLLGHSLPYWALPVLLEILTIIIAFSTGTSWGTYAVALPLAMPLAWAIATSQGLSNPELYLLVSFAAVINGSVYGDQCSPISDTTILSSMCTGCDLMDHVRTQIIPASVAAGIAGILWTLVVLFFVK